MVYSDHEVGAEIGSRPLVARVGHVGSPHQLRKGQPLRRHKCTPASLNTINLADSFSFSWPHRPLGSAAVTACPARMGLSSSLRHSSGVKVVLLAVAALLP